MGQIADDMVNGLCCELCGCYFVDKDENLYDHGHPVVCDGCWSELTTEEKKVHIRCHRGAKTI